MTTHLIISAVVCFLGSSSDDALDVVVREKQQLKGVWRWLAKETRDTYRTFRKKEQGGWSFDGDFLYMKDDTGERAFRFLLDPSRDPKTIDIIKGKDPFKPVTYLGIYRLKDDTLTIVTSPAERPKEFVIGPKDQGLTVITVFVRVR